MIGWMQIIFLVLHIGECSPVTPNKITDADPLLYRKALALVSDATFRMYLDDNLTVDICQKLYRRCMWLGSSLHMYLNVWHHFSFINKKIAANSKTHVSVIPFSVTYVISDTMIVFTLCVLLRNRRSEVQGSRYLFLSFRLGFDPIPLIGQTAS